MNNDIIITITSNANREQYERDLAERQRQHLESVRRSSDMHWQPCLHDNCTECYGTGVRHDGSGCVHMMSCPCPKCTPRY